MDPETHQMHLIAGRRYGREATCGTKINYEFEDIADKAVVAMKNKASKPLEAYPCFWCNGWHIGRKMSEQELREASTGMELFGQTDPLGGDGYIPGAWDEVRHAYLDGHISTEAYEVLHRAVQPLREQTDL
jgi:hypothetical protein